MKLGISSYSLTWSVGVPGYESPKQPVDAVALLHKAHRDGINVVQIADNIPLQLMNAKDIEIIGKTAEHLGITLELGTRGTSPDILLHFLLLSKTLKSKIVRTLITIPDIHQAEKDLLQVLPEFSQAEIVIAVENHGLHTTKQLVSLFDRIGSPFVGCCLDTVNSFGALECPEQVINSLLPYTLNLHVKDFDITRVKHQMGFEILGTPAGSGRLDIEKLLKSLEALERKTNVILELWTPFTNTVEETIQLENEWFDKSIKYLKSKLGHGIE